MAIPWIKIETSLPRKPEVMRLAELLDIDEFAVVGHLVCFWSWVDENVSPECPSVSGTKRGLDRVAGRDGFTTAMIEVGWLVMEDGKVTIPHLEYHLSSGAKTRAFEQRKKAEQRKQGQSSGKCPDKSGTTQGQKQGPEEIREEKNRLVIQTQGPQGTPKAAREFFRKPSVQDVAEYATGICANVDPQAFYDHYQSNGWRVGKAAMKDWKAAVRNWAKRDLEGKAKNDSAVRAGFTAQARQDAQWAVFREFEEAAARDEERERQRRIASGGEDSGDEYRPDGHATLFG